MAALLRHLLLDTMEHDKYGKEWFPIHTLHLEYTEGMEKAMHSAHGVGYEVYMRRHKVRMNVEARREQDYKETQHLVADLERKIYTSV